MYVCGFVLLSMEIRDKSCCISFLLHCVSVSNLKQQLPLQQEQYGGIQGPRSKFSSGGGGGAKEECVKE